MDNEHELPRDPIVDEPGAYPTDGDEEASPDPNKPRYLLLKFTQRAYDEVDNFPEQLAKAMDACDVGEVDVIELEPDLIDYIESHLED